MEIRYYVDPVSGLLHIHTHGVEEWEVEDVLHRPLAESPSRDGARLALGQTRNGRYLKVVFVPDEYADSVFVITAYPLSWRGLRNLRRRRKKKA